MTDLQKEKILNYMEKAFGFFLSSLAAVAVYVFFNWIDPVNRVYYVDGLAIFLALGCVASGIGIYRLLFK